MNRQEIEDRAVEVLTTAGPDLVAAYLFGSVSRDTATAGSDVDIGILLQSTPPGRLQDLRSALEGLLEKTLNRRVQVVVLNLAPADLVHRVLRDGRLLLDRDKAARIRFEVRVRNEYFDLVPTLNRYRRRETAAP
ncbi:MAG: nucleotidyltransferase domain-containing protein [Acidobacteria bacterium]|nr:nucleotidyltransferase domain-containing protein [Acidobacteriota bacterium]